MKRAKGLCPHVENELTLSTWPPGQLFGEPSPHIAVILARKKLCDTSQCIMLDVVYRGMP